MTFEDRRRKIVDTIPSWYRPLPHAIVPSVLGITIITFCLYLMFNVQWISFLAIPITLFFLFGFEWLVHKYVLHAKQPLLGQIYQLHELSHHVIYTHEKMAMSDQKELYFIMMPPYAILLVFFLIAPLAFGLGVIFSLNVACLILITAMLFFLIYEWLHFSYHQPPNSFLGRNRIVRKLRRLHRRHHNPRLMKRWNFNVTIPVFDWILGTFWRKSSHLPSD